MHSLRLHHEKHRSVNVQCRSQQVLRVTFEAVVSVSSMATFSTPIPTWQEMINGLSFWHTHSAHMRDTYTHTCPHDHTHIQYVHVYMQTNRSRHKQTHRNQDLGERLKLFCHKIKYSIMIGWEKKPVCVQADWQPAYNLNYICAWLI